MNFIGILICCISFVVWYKFSKEKNLFNKSFKSWKSLKKIIIYFQYS